MSLLGVRDLSLIQTAPKNRMSIKTVVVPFSDAIVQKAIDAELDRGGQVYYLHNRIDSIYGVARALEQLVPKARVAVGHGQMSESELEPIMARFVDGEIDVLVATTIIENGIDIPNVNTIVVNDADRFGLAQLYQLRGRVGRSNHQAYAYLLYRLTKRCRRMRRRGSKRFESSPISAAACKSRCATSRSAARATCSAPRSRGSSAPSASRRTASCSPRRSPSARARKRRLPERREAVIDVKIDAYIPNDYIPQVSQKIGAYQQLAGARSEAEVDELAEGLRDRFGALPEPLANLVEITKLRTVALRKGVTRVVIDESRLILGVGAGFEIAPSAIPKLQSLTRNRFRFGDGRITIDLPPRKPVEHLPLLRFSLLDAL